MLPIYYTTTTTAVGASRKTLGLVAVLLVVVAAASTTYSEAFLATSHQQVIGSAVEAASAITNSTSTSTTTTAVGSSLLTLIRNAANHTATGTSNLTSLPAAAVEGDEEEEEEDEDEADEEVDEDDEEEFNPLTSNSSSDASKVVKDLFGNKLKLENNRTFLVGQNKRRDLGLIVLKAILLGPLIGVTIKAALIRGLIWAVGAYLLHLFFPALLTTLGLGTGLVGFARQLQPDYAQMLLPHLADIPVGLRNSLPTSLSRMVTQYMQMIQPVVESIQSIPEGHCRFRAVCETASHLVRNTQFLSQSLQRISATVYLNFGTEYSKAWLDGIVQSDCATRYASCPTSPFSMVAGRLAEAVRAGTGHQM